MIEPQLEPSIKPSFEPPRLSLARLPTPLEKLTRLSEEVGINIWVKRDDLTETGACGNKIRKLEFSIAQALTEGADVLVTAGGVQSNHCRATAVMASRLGLGSHLLLRGKEPAETDGNLLLDRLVGAGISFLPAQEYQDLDARYDEIREKYAASGRKTYFIPVGASDEVGLWGYIECVRELMADFAAHSITPGAIISATGSGGTLGGLILGKAMYGLDADIMAFNVCDDEAWFVSKITEDFSRWTARYGHDVDKGVDKGVDTSTLPINVIDGYVGPGYGRAGENVLETIRTVARLEGIILDPVYTGKAFDAMLAEIRLGRFKAVKDIVFIHTGGVFGLFPQKTELFHAD